LSRFTINCVAKNSKQIAKYGKVKNFKVGLGIKKVLKNSETRCVARLPYTSGCINLLSNSS